MKKAAKSNVQIQTNLNDLPFIEIPKQITCGFTSGGKPEVAVQIKVHAPEFLPAYQTEGSACFDLIANIPPQMFDGVNIGSKVQLNFRGMAVVETGISVAVPDGYKLCVSARSGLASRGLVVMNAPGQVDSDYRGVVKVILANVTGKEILTIKHGERFAQAWIEPVYKAKWEVVEELPATQRGEGGLGSTGA